MTTLYAENFQDNSGKLFGTSGCDNGQALNNLWSNLSNDDEIIIPPGAYNAITPVVWTGKRFSCLADGSIIGWSNLSTAGITIDSCDDFYIRGMNLSASGSLSPVNSIGVKILNSSYGVLERCWMYNFQTGLLQSGSVKSHYNTLRDCNVICVSDYNESPMTKRNTCVKTEGTNSGHMRISGGDYSNMTTAFDFRLGCGGNHVIGPSTQTHVWGCYLVRLGNNDNYIEPTYYEGPPGPSAASYPESLYSPYDTTEHMWTSPYQWPSYNIDITGNNNIILLNYAGIYILDTGSNNTVVNNITSNYTIQTRG